MSELIEMKVHLSFTTYFVSLKMWLHAIAHNLFPDCSCLIMRMDSERPFKDKSNETSPISLGHCQGSEQIDWKEGITLHVSLITKKYGCTIAYNFCPDCSCLIMKIDSVGTCSRCDKNSSAGPITNQIHAKYYNYECSGDKNHIWRFFSHLS